SEFCETPPSIYDADRAPPLLQGSLNSAATVLEPRFKRRATAPRYRSEQPPRRLQARSDRASITTGSGFNRASTVVQHGSAMASSRVRACFDTASSATDIVSTPLEHHGHRFDPFRPPPFKHHYRPSSVVESWRVVEDTPVAAAKSPAPAAGQIVQRPVKRREFDLEVILRQEILLGGRELRLDERERGLFDRTPSAERRRRLFREYLRKLLRSPRKDRTEEHFIGGAIDVHALRMAHTFVRNLTELLVERICGKCLTA